MRGYNVTDRAEHVRASVFPTHVTVPVMAMVVGCRVTHTSHVLFSLSQ